MMDTNVRKTIEIASLTNCSVFSVYVLGHGNHIVCIVLWIHSESYKCARYVVKDTFERNVQLCTVRFLKAEVIS